MALNLDGFGSENEEGNLVVFEMNLDVIRPKFEDYKNEALEIVANAQGIEITNDESLNIAVTIGGNAKKVAKAIDVQRKAIILGPSEFVRSVNSLCKAITDNLDETERITKQKIGQYRSKIELERRKQEELARKAAEELQKKINAEAKKSGVEAPQVVVPVIPVAHTVVRTESAAAHQRKVWAFEILDKTLVPAEYKTIDEQLIKNSIKMGIRTIPGVRIFEETKTVFRI